MKLVSYIVFNILETLLRIFPIPCKTGVIKIGNPDRNSPVFLTCNFHLTVARVKRALRELDAYLLVANSRGINVWCAATGGLFTHHDVISSLKVSGIEQLVAHRNVILPQLAGTGVEATTIKKKTGWNVIWGPIYAKDIQNFLNNKSKKDASMSKAEFPLAQRIEMAVSWAFPIFLVLTLILLLVWREAILPMIVLVWGISFLIFLSFPFYNRLFKSKHGIVDFGRGGFQFVSWLVLMIGFIGYSRLIHPLTPGITIRWGLLLTAIIFAISIDILGCTPLYKSGFHDDRLLNVILHEDKCKGVGFCQQVCPGDCFEIDKNKKIATMPRADNCVQCGACIVQCPCDALYFQSPRGEMIPPASIRKYKLNLMGKRLVKV